MRRRRMIISSLAIGAVSLSACGKAAELGTEQLIESQSGGDVDLDLNGDGGFSVETEDGSMTIDENGNFVVTDESGEVVTGNANEDGDLNVESEDGEFRIDSSGEVPDEWPADVPRPDAIDGATSSIQNSSDMLAISVTGSAAEDFFADYGSALEAAGFEETSSFTADTTVNHTYENAEWVVNVGGTMDGSNSAASVSLYNASS
jgi:hypothetical protein